MVDTNHQHHQISDKAEDIGAEVMPGQLAQHRVRTTVYIDRKVLEAYRDHSDKPLGRMLEDLLRSVLGDPEKEESNDPTHR